MTEFLFSVEQSINKAKAMIGEFMQGTGKMTCTAIQG